MDRKVLILPAVAIAMLGWAMVAPAGNTGEKPLDKLKQTYAVKHKPSVDHSQFPQLKAKFASPQELTKACISCHNKRHLEVMKSNHWNWEHTEYVSGRGLVKVGKKNILNNFCIGTRGSEVSCAKCHIGYGMTDSKFNFQDASRIDCLACHDNSGLYVKASGAGGMPEPNVNLNLVAASVGRPQRSNCGACHFFGGGGNNVKHGDLEKALMNPEKSVDVHMTPAGSDMQCVDCHKATNHKILGKMYSISSMNRDRVECSSCHGSAPHQDEMVNKHMDKVACQTCHIPTYAKVNPTKMHWDWSTAGKLKDGKPYVEEGPMGVDTYMSIKGTFTWKKDVVPDYIWFNGTASHYLVGDKIDPSQGVKLNTLNGSYDDPDSKIVPVKIHRSNQIYDTVNNWLIQPKLASSKPGDGAYWKEFNWSKASAAGMKEVGLPFSGKFDFVNTEMTWPINHMVVSKEGALACQECHTRDKGRLASLKGFYLPGRDSNEFIDKAGILLVGFVIFAAILHGAARAIYARRNSK